jgi:hypothetical protein
MPARFEGHAPDGHRRASAPACWPFGTVTPPDPRSSLLAPITGLPETLTPAELRELPAALF